MLPSADVNNTRGRRSMDRGIVFVLVLFCLSGENPVSASQGALEKLIEWHGSGGSLSQEEFISLGRGVQSGQTVTTNGDLLAGKNGSCVSTSALCVENVFPFACEYNCTDVDLDSKGN